MKSQVLLTVWCNISGGAGEEIWHWSLSGVKGLIRYSHASAHRKSNLSGVSWNTVSSRRSQRSRNSWGTVRSPGTLVALRKKTQTQSSFPRYPNALMNSFSTPGGIGRGATFRVLFRRSRLSNYFPLSLFFVLFFVWSKSASPIWSDRMILSRAL